MYELMNLVKCVWSIFAFEHKMAMPNVVARIASRCCASPRSHTTCGVSRDLCFWAVRSKSIKYYIIYNIMYIDTLHISYACHMHIIYIYIIYNMYIYNIIKRYLNDTVFTYSIILYICSLYRYLQTMYKQMVIYNIHIHTNVYIICI